MKPDIVISFSIHFKYDFQEDKSGTYFGCSFPGSYDLYGGKTCRGQTKDTHFSSVDAGYVYSLSLSLMKNIKTTIFFSAK